VTDDIAAVASICAEHDAVLKVILETCLLTDDEIIKACKAAERGGADFVKTSTGFAAPPEGKTSGATVHDVKLMRSAISDNVNRVE
jgi:deoxyribose-phosphate aldolase